MSRWQRLRPKNRLGVTLIEMLVAISLSVIIITALYYVFTTSHKSYIQNSAKAEINQNARIAQERISRDLRQATRIVTTLPLDDTDPLNPAPSTIMFQDGHDAAQIQYIEYSFSDGQLHRKVIHYYFTSDPSTWTTWDAQDQEGSPAHESIDEDVIKANKLTSLKFYGNKVITVELVSSENEQNQTYLTQVLGRNIQ